MSSCVLDSSALLALLLNEPGADLVAGYFPDVCMSAVNLAEVIAKLCERGMPPEDARQAVANTGIDVVAFDEHQAHHTGALRSATRAFGLSLGDRACLALAQSRGLPAVTADRVWQQVADLTVVLIRA